MTPENITTVNLAVLKDGRVLCVRKSPEHDWILPGGMPEDDEVDIETLNREVREELGCGIRLPLDWLGVFQGPAADRPGVTVTVRVYVGELDGEPRPNAEITGMRWIALSYRGDDLAPSLRRHILPELAEGTYRWRW